ncbi:regulatory protein RecX [Brytella acorum]|uniref:Regulatory protein RecX n=1 Tax=Brytella acorum TaxID=2959299 RepID=A0AA35URU9_9PROT|nr:RecX family transcriptional regulator [Brytella acorum]MDF3625109.1 RecX family transcriptional regulator [Brytella acorum]CAI9121012.1 RecX family transcriptional regulator [Brytella acorum]
MAEKREMTAPVAPDVTTLREFALNHLARFATTEQGLEQVLVRYMRRWARRAEKAHVEGDVIERVVASSGAEIAQVCQDIVRLGIVDDGSYARSRARGLTRTGRSRQAVAATLIQRGVATPVLSEALDEVLGSSGDEDGRRHELGAALVMARKRRLGPFSPRESDEAPDDAAAGDDTRKALGIFARHGFSRDVAETVLSMDFEEAEERVIAIRGL